MELGHAVDDMGGPGVAQARGMVRAPLRGTDETDWKAACRDSTKDALRIVIDKDRLGWGDPQTVGREQRKVGRGLGAGDLIGGIDMRAEAVDQRRAPERARKP